MSWKLLHHLFDDSALVSEKSSPKHFSAGESGCLASGVGHCYFEISVSWWWHLRFRKEMHQEERWKGKRTKPQCKGFFQL